MGATSDDVKQVEPIISATSEQGQTLSIKNRQDFEKYLERLQTVEGQALTGAHSIYCSVLENLYFNPLYKNDPEAIELREEVANGGRIDLKQRQFQNPKIQKLFSEAEEEYKKYCQERYSGFHEILSEYDKYNKEGTGRSGPLRRWWNERSYQGIHGDDEAYQDFIELIDQIALIDTLSFIENGKITETAVEALKDCLEKYDGNFDYHAQSEFLNFLYTLLMDLQSSYFAERHLADKRKIEHLQKYYGIADQDALKKYYRFIVYNEKQLGKPDPVAPPVGKDHFQDQLIFDIHQTRDQIKDAEKDFNKELKLLKKSIHHVAQGLGLASHVKKTSELFDEFVTNIKADVKKLLEERKAAFEKSLEEYNFYFARVQEEGTTNTILKAFQEDPLDSRKQRELIKKLTKFSEETFLIEQWLEKWLENITQDFHAIDLFSNEQTALYDLLNNLLEKNLDALAARLNKEYHLEEHHTREQRLNKKIAQAKQELECLYYIETDIALCKREIFEDQRKIRAIEQSNESIAKKSSKITSFGEGCVAASTISLAFVLGSPLVILLAVLFAGYYINNLLFKGDNRSVLDAIRIKKKIKLADGTVEEHRLLFLGPDGKPISPTKKIIITALGSLSVGTGIVYGTLSFMSSYVTLPTLFTQISQLFGGYVYSHLPILFNILQFAGSVLPGIGMAIGITCIFFTVVADFIREKRWIAIKDYFNVNFLLKNGNKESAFWTMTLKQKAWHGLKCAGRLFLLGIGIGVTVFVTYFSAGFFYKDSLAFLHLMATADPMRYIAKLATWTNAFISTPFQVQGTNNVLQPKADFTFSGVSKVTATPDHQLVSVSDCPQTGSSESSSPVTPPSTGTSPEGLNDSIRFATETSTVTDLSLSDTKLSEVSTGARESTTVLPSCATDDLLSETSITTASPEIKGPAKTKPSYDYEFLASKITSEIGYVLVNDQLLYINKVAKYYKLVPLEEGSVPAVFQELLKGRSVGRPVDLDNSALEKIHAATGHVPYGFLPLSEVQKDARKVLQGERVLATVSAGLNGIGYSFVTRPQGSLGYQVVAVTSSSGYSAGPNMAAASKVSASRLRTPSNFMKARANADLLEKKSETPAQPQWRCALTVR